MPVLQEVDDKAKALIRRHEGLRLKMYTDTVGVATIGYGHNLVANPIPEVAADAILQADLDKVVAQLSLCEWYLGLDVNRQAVIIDMTFNLGFVGVTKFGNMIRAIQVRDYATAAQEMLNSQWARQVPIRAAEDSEIMRTGIL